jgi:hypothetical protein
MKIKQWLSLFAVLSSILLLAACGSNSGSGGDQSAAPAADDKGSDPTTGIEYAGTDKCIGCHDDISWSADIVDAYLMGKHVIHSDHITAADEVDGCLDCHDPIGDGAALEALIDPANVPTEGLAAVGCETCHGAGGDHYGVGPMPNARPEADACAQCHDELPESHLTHHPEANFIASDYFTSGHSGADGRNEAICVKCHNDEGARKYKDVTTWEGLAATLPIEGATHAIQCRTCHDPHHAGKLLVPGQDSGYPDHIMVESTEYATCTNCHQGSDAQLVSLEGKTYAQWEAEMLALDGSSDRAEGDLIYHAARYERVISSTHYDNPLTDYNSSHLDGSDPTYAPSKIEGYVVRAANDHACRDCHNVHAANTEINQQWARSGHGGELLTVKEAVDADGHSITGAVDIRLAGATDDTAAGWNHYDWDAGNHQSCQKCHTSTGFVTYAADPENYAPANNDFSHLEGWSMDEAGNVTSSGQNEMLYCWGCHSDNSGALRVEEAVTADYTLGGSPVVFPDSGDSNTCYVCHAGRGNNETASTSSRFAGHHAPAAATLFSELTNVAYEYPGQDYTNVPYFEHDSLGSEGDGPCVACHMNGEKDDHTFAVVNKDSAGTITSIRAENCVTCHDGEHALFVAESQIGETHDLWNGTDSVPTEVTQAHVDTATAELEHEAEGYQEAGQLLNDLINNANGLRNYTGAVIDQNNGLEEDRGAFQNAKLTSDEPGGYAHNRYYVKKAIFDAIDWAEDGSIDGTINNYSANYPRAIGWLGTERP